MPSERISPPTQLSVVVTIVDAGETLAECLQALMSQDGAFELEVVVPYDDTVRGVGPLIERFPGIRFLPLGRVRTAQPPATERGRHELFDRRRAAGLAAATGSLVAILEDRGIPRRAWAATAVELHAELPYAVIGGAIENGRDRVLNWAVYYCDFGRYQLPFRAGPRRYVSDTNVCYKRRALAATEPLWRERYHEPLVHDALLASGETLFLSPELIVEQRRRGLTMAGLLTERLAWGRLFGAIRSRHSTAAKRAALIVLSPVLPALLAARLVRDRLVKRSALARFVIALPAAVLLLCAWSVGEALGYLFPRRS